MANSFSISIVGADEPGIIATVSDVLLKLECNLADTNMSVLSGNFAMVLIVQAPEGLKRERLESELNEATTRFNLLISVQRLVETWRPRLFASDARMKRESAMITVYGADRPGIVHSVTSAIASLGSNIVDFRTEQFNTGHDLYSLFMEVSLPDEVSREQLERAIEPVRANFGVQVSIQTAQTVEL